MASNSTAQLAPAIGTNIVIPLLSAFSALILILIVILVIVLCRRKARAMRLRSDSEITVQVVKATTNGGHVTLQNEESVDGFSSVQFSVPSPKAKPKSLPLDLPPKPQENGTRHSPAEINPTYIDFGEDASAVSPTTVVVGQSPKVASRPPSAILTDGHTPDSPGVEVARLTQTARSPDEGRTVVCSTPELPKLRGRWSKNNAASDSALNILTDNKQTTLQRASNLFRSDTKAHEFYAKSITNYELRRDHLKSVRLIGKGHFGCVYLGEAAKLPNSKKQNTPVAIKTMKNSAPDSEKQEFLYELEIMKLVNSLNHPNIIKLLACCTSAQPYLIVLEFMSHGNLQKFLRDTKSGDVYYNLHGQSDSLTERHLLKFALDIARGMEGVADLQLLHRDLATRNILLAEDLTCKVADFGFAKDVLNKPEYKSKSVFQRPRPTRWLPPESLFTFKHSIQSDVWSYGIVLWEIVTLGNLPYPQMGTREVMKAIARGYRMPRPPHCSPDIYRVMAECWEERSNRRPSFKQIAEKMEQLLQQSEEMDGVIDMKQLHQDDYVDILPTGEHEIMLEYAASETLC